MRSVDPAKRCGAPAVYVGEASGRAFPLHACEACALAIDNLGGWRTGKVRKLP